MNLPPSPSVPPRNLTRKLLQSSKGSENSAKSKRDSNSSRISKKGKWTSIDLGINTKVSFFATTNHKK